MNTMKKILMTASSMTNNKSIHNNILTMTINI